MEENKALSLAGQYLLSGTINPIIIIGEKYLEILKKMTLDRYIKNPEMFEAMKKIAVTAMREGKPWQSALREKLDKLMPPPSSDYLIKVIENCLAGQSKEEVERNIREKIEFRKNNRPWSYNPGEINFESINGELSARIFMK